MSNFLSNLDLIVDFLFSVLSAVFDLMVTNPILISVFGLYILGRVFRIFDILKS